MKISKTTKKIGAGVLLLLLVGAALKMYGKKDMSKSNTLAGTKSSEAPNEFNVFNENSTDSGTKFWKEGKSYYKQIFGPLVKPGKPLLITEEEFNRFYSN